MTDSPHTTIWVYDNYFPRGTIPPISSGRERTVATVTDYMQPTGTLWRLNVATNYYL